MGGGNTVLIGTRGIIGIVGLPLGLLELTSL